MLLAGWAASRDGARAAYGALTADTIDACFQPAKGTLYIVGGGSARDGCQPNDVPISWNARGPAGQDGADGVGVTSAALAPGDDAACPLGGSRFTSATGVSYACNGGFTGVSTSPNGSYSIALTDTGIALHGPNAQVDLNGSGIAIASGTGLNLDAGTTMTIRSSGTITVDGAGLVRITGSIVDIN